MANINKYTEKTKEALLNAQERAEQLNHSELHPEHLLLSLLDQPEGVVPQIIGRLNVNPTLVKGQLNNALNSLPRLQNSGQIYASARTRQVLLQAAREADNFKDEYVST